MFLLFSFPYFKKKNESLLLTLIQKRDSLPFSVTFYKFPIKNEAIKESYLYPVFNFLFIFMRKTFLKGYKKYPKLDDSESEMLYVIRFI